jgi:hypothetical protein
MPNPAVQSEAAILHFRLVVKSLILVKVIESVKDSARLWTTRVVSRTTRH